MRKTKGGAAVFGRGERKKQLLRLVDYEKELREYETGFGVRTTRRGYI